MPSETWSRREFLRSTAGGMAASAVMGIPHPMRPPRPLPPESREAWLRWRANLSPIDNYLDVPDSDHLVVTKTGTINCDAVTPQGDLSSVTTTAGLSWKIPGRVGDSPIIGAGQYCDNDIGAAG